MARNHIVQGSVSYTEIGNPSIVNGIVSTSSDSDYLQLSSQITLNSSADLEIYTRFKTPSEFPSGNCTILGVSKNDTPVMWIWGKYVFFTIRGSSNTAQVGTVSENTWYRAKAVCKNNNWSLSLYDDNGSLINNYTITAANSSDYTYYIRPMCYYGVNPPVQFLDLNVTYIKLNGAAWFGPCPVEVKHINHGTTVGYTKVGTPTISNGVVSGFSENDFLQTTVNLPISNNEIYVTATTSSDVSSSQVFFSCGTSSSNRTLACTIENGGYFGYGYSLNGSVWQGGYKTTNYLLEANNTYNISYSFSSSDVTVKIKKSTETSWTEFSNQLTQSLYNSNTYLKFGRDIFNPAKPFNGSIDLNYTSVYVNGKLWFFRPCVNYQVYNDKLVFADSGLYIQEPGTADYTVVGSPTFNNGVVSGFSQNNYLTIDKVPTGTINSFEIVFDITNFPATFNNEYENIIARKANDTYCPNIFVRKSNGIDYMFFCSYRADHTYSTIAAVEISGFRPNATVKLTWDSQSGKAEAYRNDIRVGSAYHYDISWDAELIIGNNFSTTGFFEGAINLENSYIKINGDTWWSGAGGAGQKVYATNDIAPVPSGFQVGSITTPSIGYIDMRTQTFTAAPIGSTIGKDE